MLCIPGRRDRPCGGDPVIDPDLLTAHDFISVRAGLVAALGGDANRAIVLGRIHFRSQGGNVESLEVDGVRWWRTTREQLAVETGLSVDQIKRILKWLTDEGHIESAVHHIDGKWDQTRSYRVATERRAESPEVGAESPNEIGAESPNLPSIKKREEEELLSEVGIGTGKHVEPSIVSSLLDMLDAGISANGSRVPVRNKANVDAMRLLIERDKRSPDEIAHVIGWCTTDSFWKSNILSAAKLRDKYDQLRLKAQVQQAGNRAAMQDQNFRDTIGRARQLQEQLDAMGEGRR